MIGLSLGLWDYMYSIQMGLIKNNTANGKSVKHISIKIIKLLYKNLLKKIDD